ncbi:CheY-like receiver [Syntrophobacter sp. SbD1]|nr:CheY-like receiver [Syntrophobacter sp. SbD1]
MLLMADDDDDDCQFVKDALVELGFLGESWFVHDGEKLFSYLRHSNNGGPTQVLRPDLILVDLIMPRKDGIQILREIKSYPEFQDIPIVLYTSSSDARKKEQCLAAGAACWITKAFQFDAVVEDIKSLLSTYDHTN